jgi:hypothetical protein
MYLRHTTRRKDGKAHVYWQLVRSVRHGRKVVQQTVAQLGELDGEGRARAEELAVKLDAIRLERSRSFGAVWLGWLLWRGLKLDDLLSELLPLGRERVSWAQVIAILVIGRLCEPSSELHVAEGWYRTTALEDLLGVSTDILNYCRSDPEDIFRCMARSILDPVMFFCRSAHRYKISCFTPASQQTSHTRFEIR